MKTLLFRVFSSVIILVILVFVCVFEDKVVSTSFDKVSNYCISIEEEIEKNGEILNGNIAFLVDNLEYFWKKQENVLCYMTNHKSIEGIGLEIVRLKNYIKFDEETEFHVSLKMIEQYTEVYQHFLGANFHNLF